MFLGGVIACRGARNFKGRALSSRLCWFVEGAKNLRQCVVLVEGVRNFKLILYKFGVYFRGILNYFEIILGKILAEFAIYLGRILN